MKTEINHAVSILDYDASLNPSIKAIVRGWEDATGRHCLKFVTGTSYAEEESYDGHLCIDRSASEAQVAALVERLRVILPDVQIEVALNEAWCFLPVYSLQDIPKPNHEAAPLDYMVMPGTHLDRLVKERETDPDPEPSQPN